MGGVFLRNIYRAYLLLLIMSMMFSLQVEAACFPERPPIPAEGLNDEKTIVIVSGRWIAEVISRVTAEIPSSKIRKTFSLLYHGFSMELAASEIETLKSLEDVERVDRIAYYEASLEGSVPFIGGDQARGMFDREGSRITGKGVKVAVIDTGIDYHHPDLQKNYKGGFDVVDYDRDPMETTTSQGVPTLHGTHVAGIIAANGKVKGVAPEAEIYAYRHWDQEVKEQRSK